VILPPLVWYPNPGVVTAGYLPSTFEGMARTTEKRWQQDGTRNVSGCTGTTQAVTKFGR